MSSSANFDDYGDISISSDAPRAITPRGRRSTSPAAAPPPTTSKFLKKKTPQAASPVVQQTRKGATAQSLEDEDEDYHKAGGQIVISGKRKVEGLLLTSLLSQTLFITDWGILVTLDTHI